MAKNPYAPPASEEEQLREVARLLGVALGRWHKLNRTKIPKSASQVEEARPVQLLCASADNVVYSAAPLSERPD